MGISLDKIDEACHSIAATISDGGNSITVDAIDLDIRDLNSSQDNVEIQTAAGQALAIDGSGFLTVNQGTSPWVVSATDLDIRNLDCTTDNVKICQGGNDLIVNADGSLNVQSFIGGFATYKVTAESVDDTAGGTEIVSAPLASRLKVLVQNLGDGAAYFKEATGVTAANGACIPACSSYEAELDAGADLFVIAEAGKTLDLRVIEYAA